MPTASAYRCAFKVASNTASPGDWAHVITQSKPAERTTIEIRLNMATLRYEH